MPFHGNEVKTRVGNGKKIYPLQAILLSFVFIFLLQRCFKESNTDLYEHIENVVGTKFQNYHKWSFGVHKHFYVRKTVNVMIMNYAS